MVAEGPGMSANGTQPPPPPPPMVADDNVPVTGQMPEMQTVVEVTLVRGSSSTENGSEPPQMFPLRAGGVLRIGRATANDFHLDHMGVSAFHCELFLRPVVGDTQENGQRSKQLLCVRHDSKNGTGVRPGPDAPAADIMDNPSDAWEPVRRGAFRVLDHGWQLILPLKGSSKTDPVSARVVTLLLKTRLEAIERPPAATDGFGLPAGAVEAYLHMVAREQFFGRSKAEARIAARKAKELELQASDALESERIHNEGLEQPEKTDEEREEDERAERKREKKERKAKRKKKKKNKKEKKMHGRSSSRKSAKSSSVIEEEAVATQADAASEERTEPKKTAASVEPTPAAVEATVNAENLKAEPVVEEAAAHVKAIHIDEDTKREQLLAAARASFIFEDSESEPQMETMPVDEETKHERLLAAAKAISQADVLLLCTGAGFSADSGLAVYKDIAHVAAYHKRNLEYHDICKPHWLQLAPSLFYGFWGSCFNDYRHCQPHRGYEIVATWQRKWFRDTAVARSLQKRLQKELEEKSKDDELDALDNEPYKCDRSAGAFFIFTSNVDAHSFDHFDACEVRECHGNTELWQCSRPFKRSCQKIWRAPTGLEFSVDLDMMEAGESAASNESQIHRKNTDELDKPRVGRVHRSGRPRMLQGWPAVKDDMAGGMFANPNRPVCPSCQEAARPAILMFSDFAWVDNDAQEDRYHSWLEAVAEETDKRGEGNPLKACILEIGAGMNVPTVRRNSEAVGRKLANIGAKSTVVRINLDFPRMDGSSATKMDFVPLCGGGLATLETLNTIMCSPDVIEISASEASSGNGLFLRVGMHCGRARYRRLADEEKPNFLYYWDGEGDSSCAGWYVAEDPSLEGNSEYEDFWVTTADLPISGAGDCGGRMEVLESPMAEAMAIAALAGLKSELATALRSDFVKATGRDLEPSPKAKEAPREQNEKANGNTHEIAQGATGDTAEDDEDVETCLDEDSDGDPFENCMELLKEEDAFEERERQLGRKRILPQPGSRNPGTPAAAVPTPAANLSITAAAVPTPAGAVPTPSAAAPTPGTAVPTPAAAAPTPGAVVPPTPGTGVPPTPGGLDDGDSEVRRIVQAAIEARRKKSKQTGSAAPSTPAHLLHDPAAASSSGAAFSWGASTDLAAELEQRARQNQVDARMERKKAKKEKKASRQADEAQDLTRKKDKKEKKAAKREKVEVPPPPPPLAGVTPDEPPPPPPMMPPPDGIAGEPPPPPPGQPRPPSESRRSDASARTVLADNDDSGSSEEASASKRRGRSKDREKSRKRNSSRKRGRSRSEAKRKKEKGAEKRRKKKRARRRSSSKSSSGSQSRTSHSSRRRTRRKDKESRRKASRSRKRSKRRRR